MAKNAERRLFLFGRYSLALLLPKKWLKEVGVKPGDPVKLEFDQARSRIVIRLENTTLPTPAKPKKSTKKSEGDWQPIPQL